MMMSETKGEIEAQLEQGIAAAKSGNKERARSLLLHVIDLDQHSEQAWLWLTAVIETTADRITCLENVLFINPSNTLAAAGLQRLRQEPPDPLAPASTLPLLATSHATDEWQNWEEEMEEEKAPSPPPTPAFPRPPVSYAMGAWGEEEAPSPTPTPASPRPAVSQAMDEWEEWEEGEDEEEGWELSEEKDGVEASEEGITWGWATPTLDTSSTRVEPTEQICPHCNHPSPGWVYVCDHCGADMRPVDLREAISSGAEARSKSALTLLAAWGGTFTFNRLLAFLPEIELASWGRSLAALVMAALIASAWRAITTVVLRLAADAGTSGEEIALLALNSAVEMLPLILRLMLAYVPIALLTWAGARLVSGRQGFKVHAHLTAVAYSAWVMLLALLAPLITFVPYLLDGTGLLEPIVENLPTLIGSIVGLTGIIWLTQALRTAHRLSAIRAALAALLIIALSIVLLFGLELLPNEWLAKLMNMLAPALPL